MSDMMPSASFCNAPDPGEAFGVESGSVCVEGPPQDVLDAWAEELALENAQCLPDDPFDDGEPPWRPTVAELYEELAYVDRHAAMLELRRADLLAGLVGAQAEADLVREVPAGQEPSAARRAAALEAARVVVVDSAVATCGGRRGPWVGRAEFAAAPAQLAGVLRDAVDDGVVTFEQASTLVGDTADLGLPTDERAALVESVIGYAARARERTGAPVGHGGFRAKLRREVVKRAETPQRRRAALAKRRVWLRGDEDGVATVGVTGPQERCLAALSRIDAIARAVRAGGDPRTLDQLRVDAALDLLIFGQPAPDADTSVDAGTGGWPQARVHIVVSAASLLGANQEPGLVEGVPVAAATVRDMAYAQGSIWRRIVVDPLTGYAMHASVDSYRVPAEMARVVRARDGRFRGPGCQRPAHSTDVDHVRECRDGGQTSADNLQCLCRRHHTKKTGRHWSARIDEHGVLTWQLPDGTRTRTYPMDYHDLGIEGCDDISPAGAAAATDAGDPADPAASLGATKTVDPADLADTVDGAAAAESEGVPAHAATCHSYDSDPLTGWHTAENTRLRNENRDLRAQLDTERAAHHALRHEYDTFRGDHPPF